MEEENKTIGEQPTDDLTLNVEEQQIPRVNIPAEG